MLTQQDIQDLKDFTDEFNVFCQNNECNDSCEVFQKSKQQKISCFKAFCDLRRERQQ